MPVPSRCYLSALFLTAACAVSPGAAPQAPAAPHFPWRDTFTSRVEALALIETLNSDLLSHDSATLTLDGWCAAHHMADPATITAERVRDVQKPATTAQRELLQVSPTEPLAYRRVRLHCGSYILSEADNWYVPSRLTKEMNEALDHSDIAFGRAVQALQFRRRTLSATLLWRPLPDAWEMSPAQSGARGELVIPAYVLQHTAVLSLPDGTPISTLTETYTAEVLAFPQPPM